MIPIHRTPRNRSLRTTARYNFIPLPEKVVPAQPLPDQNAYHSDRLSGQIVCKLEARTPLYTRGAVRPQLFRKYNRLNLASIENNADLKAYASFFHYDEQGKPVISGSSLRGMVRGICEIIAYGKVQWVSDRPMVYRVVGDVSSIGDSYRAQFFGSPKDDQGVTVLDYPSPCVRGGYLRKRGSDWYIQPAQTDVYQNSFVHVEYATCVNAGLMRSRDDEYGPDVKDVYVLPAPRCRTPDTTRNGMRISFNLALSNGLQKANGTAPDGWMGGKLVFSHPFAGPRNPHPKHRNVVIYDPDDKIPLGQWHELTDEQVSLFREDEGLTRRNSHRPRKVSNTDGAPVLYLVDEHNPEKVVFFGPTKMFRLPYHHIPLDFVDPKLRDEKTIDLPEAVFGFVRDWPPEKNETVESAKRRAYAGRVFFGDALLQGEAQNQPLKMPQVLSAPKPTSFQNYLVQDAADAPDSSRLFHYNTDPQSGKTAIRGTKQYWHQDVERTAVNLENVHENQDPTHLPQQIRNSRTIIQPVGNGAKFQFTVRFENLSQEELGMLLWALALPIKQEGGGELCHRLGMGKPQGLGSVKIEPQLYLDNRSERYKTLFTQGSDGLMHWSGDTDPASAAKTSHQAYLDAFERYVTDGIGKNGQKLTGQERIKDLVAMLRFPGPEAEKIADPGFNNRRRNVLPTPRETQEGTSGGPLPPSPRQSGPRQTRDSDRDQVRPHQQPPQKSPPRPDITSNSQSERTKRASEDIMRNFEDIWKKRDQEEEEE